MFTEHFLFSSICLRFDKSDKNIENGNFFSKYWKASVCDPVKWTNKLCVDPFLKIYGHMQDSYTFFLNHWKNNPKRNILKSLNMNFYGIITKKSNAIKQKKIKKNQIFYMKNYQMENDLKKPTS